MFSSKERIYIERGRFISTPFLESYYLYFYLLRRDFGENRTQRIALDTSRVEKKRAEWESVDVLVFVAIEEPRAHDDVRR